MPVIKETIQGEVDILMENLLGFEPGEVPTEFSKGLSEIIMNAILSATITVPSGIAVQVTPATGTGATIAPATATIA